MDDYHRKIMEDSKEGMYVDTGASNLNYYLFFFFVLIRFKACNHTFYFHHYNSCYIASKGFEKA